LKNFLEEVLPKSLKSLEARIYNVLDDPKTLKEIKEIVKANKTNIKRAITSLTRKGEILRIDRSFYIRSIKNPTIEWVPIKEIKEKPGQYTFDFTTNIGNFVANNIITHNCWAGTDPGSKVFVNVPEDVFNEMKMRSGDWHFLLTRYAKERYAEAVKYPVRIK
jgi:predicted transcriptional regulator